MKETGIYAEQIVEMNFESHDFKDMSSDDVYHYVKGRTIAGKRMYLLPLQKIRDNYEKVVLSLEPGLDASYEGIKSENLIEWLLSE